MLKAKNIRPGERPCHVVYYKGNCSADAYPAAFIKWIDSTTALVRDLIDNHEYTHPRRWIAFYDEDAYSIRMWNEYS